MTRLQKKCLVAVAGMHLLLVVLVLCSGFIRPRPKPDDSQVLDVIPAKIIDAAFRSGVKQAQPPTPTPPTPVVTPPQPAPTPPTPEPARPVVQPPPPTPERNQPEPVEHTEPKPPEPHKIEVSMVPAVHKTTTQTDNDAAAKAEAKEAARQAKEAKRLHDAEVRAFQQAATTIRHNTSTSTTIEMPAGESSVAYADYASVVKTVYTENWTVPDSSASDDANVKVSVTISSDGRVTDAHIVEKSGDASLDSSVQRTLEKVTQIEPFPEGSSDKERTYIINFNLKSKRMLG